MSTGRDERGRFPAGESGNPGGRPKLPAAVREALRGATLRAVETLIGLLDAEDSKIRLAAAAALLNRVIGPAPIGLAADDLERIQDDLLSR